MKILVMTSVYPSPNDKKEVSITPVVHYFTKKWTEMGHEVIVVFNANRYPNIFDKVHPKFKSKLMSKFSFVPLIENQTRPSEYTIDQVKVIRIPILKIIPRGLFLNKQIIKQKELIIKELDKKSFTPNIIVSHWDNPQLQLSSQLKKTFRVKNVLVFHGLRNIKHILWGKILRKYINDVDIIGFRSINMQKEYHKLFGEHKKEFICESGLPDKYISDNNLEYKDKEFNSKVNKYLYVGSLIERKHPETLINALSKYKTRNNFKLQIVGSGPMLEELKVSSEKHSLNKNIDFIKWAPRDRIIELMKETEVFTLVSKNEVFGLVYLEAMLQGCLVVCSRSEGFDGIIKDGENGFICESGNSEELFEIYTKIDSMTLSEKKLISQNAIKTAKNYSDSNVAQRYLENITI